MLKGTLVMLHFTACRQSLVVVLAVLLSGMIFESQAGGTWASLAHSPPIGVNNCLLLSDGTVLAINGSGQCAKLTPDIHGSYVNGTWTTLASMNYSRLFFSSALLTNGNIYAAGGEYGGGPAEVYDSTANAWNVIRPPTGNYSDAACKLLPNGNVLQSDSQSHYYLYNAGLNIVQNGGSCADMNETCWTRLPNDNVVGLTGYSTTCAHYVPSLGAWYSDSNSPVKLFGYGAELGPAFVLPNGNLFQIGATTNTAIYTPGATVTNAGGWTAGPTMVFGTNLLGAVDAPAAMLVNGNVLCDLGTISGFGGPCYFFEYDYTANTFTQVGAPGGGSTYNSSPYANSMLCLPDGGVLFVGGQNSRSLYEYTPGGTPLAAGQPAIISITDNLDGSFHLTGTGLAGISAGAAYGDDEQMDSNYPLVRMTNNVTGNVYYARTRGWSSTTIQNPDPVTTEFTLPPTLPAGTYSLVVVANGNASAPVDFSVVTLNTSDAQNTSSFIGSTNWSNGQVPSSGFAYFTTTNTIRTTNTTTTGLTFSFDGDWLSIDAGGRLLGKIGNNVAGNTTTATISGNFVLNGGYVDQASAANDSSIMTVAGTVMVNAASGLGAFGATSSGSFFETMEIAAPISGSAALLVSGSSINSGTDTGVVELSVANPYSGTITVTNAKGGIVASTTNRILQLNNLNALSNATLNLVATVANPVSFTAISNTAAFNLGALAGSSSQALLDTASNAVALNVGGNNVNTTYKGVLTGSGSLTKVGMASLVLSGASTFTGGMTFSSGELDINNGGSSSASSAVGTGTLSIGASTVIDNTGSSDVTLLPNNPQIWSTGFTYTGSAHGLNLGTGPVNMPVSSTVTVSGNTLTVGGGISGASALTKAGAGTLVLTGSNSYSGGTTIKGGIVNVRNNNGFGASGTISMLTRSAGIQLQGGITMPGGVNFTLSNDGLTNPVSYALDNVSGNNRINGAISLGTGGGGTAIQSDSGTLTLAGNISIKSGQTSRGIYLQGVSTGSNTVSGVLSDLSASSVFNVIKLGTGNWTLTSANTYSGGTTVSNGTLLVNNVTGSGTGSGAVLVTGTGSVLGGAGRMTGPLTIAAGSSLAPGMFAQGSQANIIGTLTVVGTASISGAVMMKINRDVSSNGDMLAASSVTVNSGATLTVTNIGSTNLMAGDTFTLFSAPVTGAFDSVLLPSLSDSTLIWTNQLAVNGTIAIVSVINTNSTNIIASVNDGMLSLSWPQDHIGWTLQVQTNSLDVGLDTNWVDVPGSASTNIMAVPIVGTNVAAFYRLRL